MLKCCGVFLLAPMKIVQQLVELVILEKPGSQAKTLLERWPPEQWKIPIFNREHTFEKVFSIAMLVYRRVPKPSKIVDAVKTMHFSMADLDSHGNYTWNSKSNQFFLMVVYFLGWLVHEGFFVWGIIISLEVVSLTTLIEWLGPAKTTTLFFP